MSKFTTEVRYICESLADLTESKGFDDVNSIIVSSAPKIFNFNFPIFDENYRLTLECKILRHFYTREICEETVGLWKLRLDDRLNMIMPYYNQLYRSQLLNFNPFYDVDLTRSHSGSNSGEGYRTSIGDETNINSNTRDFSGNTSADGTNENIISGSSESEGTRNNEYNGETENDDLKWDLYSDTPQGGINGIEGITGQTVNNDYYLTNARKNTDHFSGIDSNTTAENNTESTTHQEESNGRTTNNEVVDNHETGTSTGTRNTNNNENNGYSNIDEYIESVQGKQGTTSYSKMLMEFRETFLNIDKMVIKELEDLFFGLWA